MRALAYILLLAIVYSWIIRLSIDGVLHRVTIDTCIVALLTSVNTLGLDGIHPAIAQFLAALKASKKDPDSPSFHEAMTGPYQEEFWEAMHVKVSESENHQCWDVVAATNVPEGAKVLPVMWVFKIKLFPDGR
jgi:hypothetical protein